MPGAQATAAVEINDRGQIVGSYSENTAFVIGPERRLRGFLLDRGRFTRIDVPGAVGTQASGINNRGQVVGEYLDAGGTFHGFLWEKGRFTTFDVPGGTGTIAYRHQQPRPDRRRLWRGHRRSTGATGPARLSLEPR